MFEATQLNRRNETTQKLFRFALGGMTDPARVRGFLDIFGDWDPTLAGTADLSLTKTVTPAPRSGNPMPRLAETECGAINSIGLENVGFEEFLLSVLPELERLGVPTVVSLAATRPEEFGPMTRRLHEAGRDLACWHGVELNLSCPNVAEGGHDFGSDPVTVAACVAAARRNLPDRALIAKLTPNTADIAALAAAACGLETPRTSLARAVIVSSTWDSTTWFKLVASASVTSPAPARMADMAVMAAAPVFPVEPATTNRWPVLPLCVSGERG